MAFACVRNKGPINDRLTIHCTGIAPILIGNRRQKIGRYGGGICREGCLDRTESGNKNGKQSRTENFAEFFDWIAIHNLLIPVVLI